MNYMYGKEAGEKLALLATVAEVQSYIAAIDKEVVDAVPGLYEAWDHATGNAQLRLAQECAMQSRRFNEVMCGPNKSQ